MSFVQNARFFRDMPEIQGFLNISNSRYFGNPVNNKRVKNDIFSRINNELFIAIQRKHFFPNK